MPFRWGRWPRYVPAAERRERALKQAAKLRGQGNELAPVSGVGRKPAKTFWGQAWCENLERYSDYANRLPRGRSYLRNGSVIDLQISPGRVTALVSGSDLYTVSVSISPVSRQRWRAICRDCGGAIDSLVELLQGKLPGAVMERICRDRSGLFPVPGEIELDCTCPDWASMCKHVAAVLYGVGVRLDDQPELLFHLRGVDAAELVAEAQEEIVLGATEPATERILSSDDLSVLFGVEMAGAPEDEDVDNAVDPQAARLRHRQRDLQAQLEAVQGRIDQLHEEMVLLVRQGLSRRRLR